MKHFADYFDESPAWLDSSALVFQVLCMGVAANDFKTMVTEFNRALRDQIWQIILFRPFLFGRRFC